jgi:isoleucyl-tRNA synthetase
MLPGSGGSVHVERFPGAEAPDPAVLDRWAVLLDARGEVNKALEEARAAKRVAASLEAKVVLRGPAKALQPLRALEACGPAFPGNLANLFIASAVSLVDSEQPLSVAVERAPGSKCERCWTWSEKVGALGAHAGVCERCASVLERP